MLNEFLFLIFKLLYFFPMRCYSIITYHIYHFKSPKRLQM